MEAFKITRLYSDKDGETRFEEIVYPAQNHSLLGYISQRLIVKDIIFRNVTPTFQDDFQNAPQKHFFVLMHGSVEIETSLNERRVFNAGQVMLIEDITGKGHRSRNNSAEVYHSLFITFDDTPAMNSGVGCL